MTQRSLTEAADAAMAATLTRPPVPRAISMYRDLIESQHIKVDFSNYNLAAKNLCYGTDAALAQAATMIVRGLSEAPGTYHVGTAIRVMQHLREAQMLMQDAVLIGPDPVTVPQQQMPPLHAQMPPTHAIAHPQQ